MIALLACALVCTLSLESVGADTPANCSYEDVRGAWTFFVGQSGLDKNLDCTNFEVKTQLSVKLTYPDLAIDQYGNVGFWTLVYNQGVEVVVHGRKFFAFSKFSGSGTNITSHCDETMIGSSHDLLGRDWSCYYGKKDTPVAPKMTQIKKTISRERLWQTDALFIEAINTVQTDWTAVHYPQFEHLTVEDITRMSGGSKSRLPPHSRPRAVPASKELKDQASQLPPAWDWRNVNGQNFVPPVRNQGGCGSCYAFSSLAMNEARLRIVSNNTIQLSFSPQDVVECSLYSQGCEGGFPYLIGGKYAEDYGLVEESCQPYTGLDGKCTTKPTCTRHYSAHYQYVGGFYGACNEESMKIALVSHGPLAVSFEVYSDFQAYKGGIYHHTGLKSPFNPFELTNHAVLLVGYGSEKGVNYWTIKNSWGPGWGEEGFFRIRRGNDECAVESIAVQSFPMF